MKIEEIDKIIQARVEDATVLFQSSRYDGSVYLCGYAIELGLKARICRTLKWNEYPTSPKYGTFKTHDLDVLLHLSGCEHEVKLTHFADWSVVAEWNPEARYNPVGSVLASDAKNMLESTKELLKIL